MRMALDRRILKRSNLEFFKLLGTGSGKTFTTKDADPLRWGLLMVGDISLISSTGIATACGEEGICGRPHRCPRQMVEARTFQECPNNELK